MRNRIVILFMLFGMLCSGQSLKQFTLGEVLTEPTIHHTTVGGFIGELSLIVNDNTEIFSMIFVPTDEKYTYQRKINDDEARLFVASVTAHYGLDFKKKTINGITMISYKYTAGAFKIHVIKMKEGLMLNDLWFTIEDETLVAKGISKDF